MNTVDNIELKASWTLGQPVREKIMGLQSVLAEMPDAKGPEEMEAEYNEHYFAPGVYGRVMHIPAGMCVVGKIHKHAHLNVITKGRIKVVTEFGESVLVGPTIFVSEPGTKRAVYALTDTDWLTVHHNPDDKTDIREIEEDVIAPSFEAFDMLQLGQGVKL